MLVERIKNSLSKKPQSWDDMKPIVLLSNSWHSKDVQLVSGLNLESSGSDVPEGAETARLYKDGCRFVVVRPQYKGHLRWKLVWSHSGSGRLVSKMVLDGATLFFIGPGSTVLYGLAADCSRQADIEVLSDEEALKFAEENNVAAKSLIPK